MLVKASPLFFIATIEAIATIGDIEEIAITEAITI